MLRYFLLRVHAKNTKETFLVKRGTVVPAAKMPKAKLNAFLGNYSRFPDEIDSKLVLHFAESFRKLKQRIFWKFD